MNLAKVSANGQVTVPIEIREKLGVKDGDKIIFLEENGRIILENSIKVALKEAQEAFRGEAERLGIKDEDDVQRLVDEVRYGKQDLANAGHA